jgi:DNA replication and repair protein RecF
MIETEFLKKDVNNRPIHVETLSLKNFRNYQELDLELGVRFNLIAGANGQGKTNLLEALHMISTTRLLRGQKEIEAIREEQDNAQIVVELAPIHTQLSVRMERGTRKQVLVNGMKLPRASDVLGRLTCVCISTEDMEIVRGEPSNRRMFLDLELSVRSPAYLRHFTIYKRALEQRNALTKQARESYVGSELWEAWEDQLGEHGAAIRTMRQEFVTLLGEELPSLHRQIGGGEAAGLQVVVKPDASYGGSPAAALANSRGMDIARGSTSIGPHRDDVEFLVDGKSARLYGSQGQQRTFVIALKLSTLLLGKARSGEAPLLLLDDIFSDLDLRRRAALVEIVLDVAGQTVLTCTEPEAAGPQILDRANVFMVSAGRIQKPS